MLHASKASALQGRLSYHEGGIQEGGGGGGGGGEVREGGEWREGGRGVEERSGGRDERGKGRELS